MRIGKNISKIGFAAMLLLATSCAVINEDLKEPEERPEVNNAELVALPGSFGINLITSDIAGSRADDSTLSSDGKPFTDGESDEFALAPSTASENYHYLLIYDPSNPSNKPAVFPIFIDATKKDDDPKEDNNLTLTIKNVYRGNEFSTTFETVDELKAFITGKRAYVLLNFQLKDTDGTNPANYTGVTFASSLTTTADKLNSLSMGDLEKLQMCNYLITAKDLNNRTQNYFTMSNSVYVKNGTKTIDSEIIRDNVFETEADAKASPAVTVHVERLASKFTVDFSELNTQTPSEDQSLEYNPLFIYSPPSSTVLFFNPDETNNGLIIDGTSYTIQTADKGYSVEVLGYAMNALEPTSFLLKKISHTGDASYFLNWNDNDNFRCYWAEDPHYDIDAEVAKFYPMQFRQVLETTGVQVKHKSGGYDSSTDKIKVDEVNVSYLNYYPFTYFIGKTGIQFSLENTYDDQEAELGDRGYYSAGTHLIMVARLNISGVNSSDLYMDQNNIFYDSESQIIEAKLNILEKVVLNQGNLGLRILQTNWKEHKPINNYTFTQTWKEHSCVWIKKQGEETWQKAEAKDFRLLEAEMSGSDGQLYIAPKDEIAEYCLAQADDSGNIIIDSFVEIKYDHIISLIHKMIGFIDHFYNGYMYYPAPITHSVASPDKDSYKTIGEIGVVRNNWYGITVESINGIGRPVDNPNQPIIPNLDVKRDYLNMTVKILDWHTIEQNVPESSLETAS